ncbi:MAG: hypothetical protein RMK52_04400 [Chitinophagales bacterium]|nr:hypothetical protein [Chitinophagales bacterium]MDW8393467.1 hypothetical protein [Chitinophagales bacterium]
MSLIPFSPISWYTFSRSSSLMLNDNFILKQPTSRNGFGNAKTYDQGWCSAITEVIAVLWVLVITTGLASK